MLEILKFDSLIKDKLSKKVIAKNLKTLRIGKRISIVDKIDSTNDWAKREIRNRYIDGSVFLAESQEKGRGRMGNSWQSENNKDVLMTVALDFKDKLIPDYITILAGLSVQKAIDLLFDCNIFVKWPNDVFIDNKKVCGILCESLKIENKNIVIIGIGINANSEALDDNIKDTATSIYLSTGKKVIREKLISEVLNMIEKYLGFEKDKIIEEYKKICISIGKDATLIYDGKEIEGQIIDLTNSGELLIKCKDDEIIKINSIHKIRHKF